MHGPANTPKVWAVHEEDESSPAQRTLSTIRLYHEKGQNSINVYVNSPESEGFSIRGTDGKGREPSVGENVRGSKLN